MDTARADGIAERYTLSHKLGEGASGTVFRAYDTKRKMEVAVKLLTRLEPGSLFRFKAEFRGLSNIAHPNLLSLYDLVLHDNTWILGMQLIEGGDFFWYVRPAIEGEPRNDNTTSAELVDVYDTVTMHGSRPDPALFAAKPAGEHARVLGPLDLARLRRAMRGLAEGLHALHATHRLHRDLKPANVLVSAADERVVICDFGLVVEGEQPAHHKAADEAETAPQSQLSEHTLSTFGTDGHVVGTAAYMSPEQALGKALTEASDWYSVGVMLYQALTGRLPFPAAANYLEAVRLRVETLPEHPCTHDDTVPRDLAELALELLRPNPLARPNYAKVLGALGFKGASSEREVPEVRRDAALVGREKELALLRGAFSEVQAGRAAVAFVAGHSGMGKSALLRTFLAEIKAQHGATVLSARCYERENLPYKAIDPLLDALSSYLLQRSDAEVESFVPEGMSALLPMFPVLERVPALKVAAMRVDARFPLDALERRKWGFRALRELLKRIARTTQLVLCIDDLQWGDLDSAAAFAELLRAPAPPNVLVIFAHRSEEETQSALLCALRERVIPESGIQHPARIALGPLSDTESLRLAQSLLEGHPRAAHVASLVCAEAEGSPFFVRELSAYGRAKREVDASELKLDAVLSARLSSLPADSQHLLAVIAVAGRPERRDVLREASGLDAAAFDAERTLTFESLVQSNGSEPTSHVEAYHDRVREAAYRALTPQEAQKLHRRIAAALRAVGEQDAERLLDHHRAAGDTQEAYACALTAAGHAEELLAFERAARLLREALAFGVAVDDEKRALAERLGNALMFSGHGPEAADAFFDAVHGATPAHAVELRSLGITQLFRAGLVSRAYSEIERAGHLVGMQTPRTTGRALLMLLFRRIRIAFSGLKPKALGKRTPTPAEILRMDLLWGIGSALSPIDQLRGGVYQAEHMLMALRAGDKYRFARALAMESTVHGTSNRDPQHTQWIIDRGLEIGGASREPHALSAVKGTSGVVRMLEGRFREAQRLTREAQEIIRERLHRTLAWDWVVMVGFDLRVTAMLGNIAELTARVPEFLRDADVRGDLYGAVSARTSHCCYAWLGIDRPDIAQREAEFADAHWKHEGYHLQNWYVTQALGEIALYRDDAGSALARLDAEWKATFIIRRKIQFSRAEIHYLRARLLLANAVHGDRKVHLARAAADAAALKRERTPWIAAHARLLDACILSFSDAPAAAALLYEAEGQFDAVDMALSAAVCRLRCGQLTLGPAGATLVADAAAAIRKLGGARVAPFARLIAPGFPDVLHPCP